MNAYEYQRSMPLFDLWPLGLRSRHIVHWVKFGTHMDSVLMFRIYWNKAAGAYSILHFSFSPIPKLKFLSHIFCETVRPSKLKFDKHMGNGLIYCV